MTVHSLRKGSRTLHRNSDGWWYGYWSGPIYGYSLPYGQLELVTKDIQHARHWWKADEMKRLRPYKKRKAA
ncbi:hypothetical protein DSS3P8_137 [Roseobacter phage DSS3P8]|nr:hypothetical protein DSS3P8_137 [Roseobacter phage DSS3P8]